MKAAMCTAYGAPEVLEVREIATPVPKKNEVLVRVIASSVNSGDVRIRALKVEGFMKVVMRLVLGVSKPRQPILGTVFAGVVEQVGPDVTKFKVGQEVYGATGFKQGCHSEYLCIAENKVITDKPKNATFEEAAALPFGGQTAIYFLRKGGIESRKTPNVLIYGASGSVGTAAVQIAKHYGATVTAVCSARNQAMVASLGAATTVAYDQQDITQSGETFDIVFDAVGKLTKQQAQPLLAPGAAFHSVESKDVAAERKEYLDFLRDLYENHNYQAVVDKTFALDQIREAHAYVDTGRKVGNVVLKIGD